MKFESRDQQKPSFEAKGLETVRRDQCALTKKILRNALVTLYRSGIEAVKPYLIRQWNLILAGQLPVSDCEFRTYSHGDISPNPVSRANSHLDGQSPIAVQKRRDWASSSRSGASSRGSRPRTNGEA